MRFACFFLARPQAVEHGERLALLPALLGRLARRLAQVIAMQHHALAVEGEHHHRLLRDRLARRRAAVLVEGVEVLGRAGHQLVESTTGAVAVGGRG